MSLKDRVSELMWECSVANDRHLYESIKRVDACFPAGFFPKFMNYILARLDDKTFGRVFRTMTASGRREWTAYNDFHFDIKNKPLIMNLAVGIGPGDAMDFDGDVITVISGNRKIQQKVTAYSNGMCVNLSFALNDGMKLDLSIHNLSNDDAQAIARRAWLYIMCNPDDFNDNHWYSNVYSVVSLMAEELEFDMEQGEIDSVGSYIWTVNACKGRDGVDEFFRFCSDYNKLDLSMLALRALEGTGDNTEAIAMRL